MQTSGLAFIRETKTLRQVSFDQCATAGDDVVALLAQNPHLDELDLTATAVTDVRTQAPRRGIKKLQTLWIGRTRLTDASLPVLAESPVSSPPTMLRYGDLPESALARLRQEKPNLDIEEVVLSLHRSIDKSFVAWVPRPVRTRQ